MHQNTGTHQRAYEMGYTNALGKALESIAGTKRGFPLMSNPPDRSRFFRRLLRTGASQSREPLITIAGSCTPHRLASTQVLYP